MKASMKLKSVPIFVWGIFWTLTGFAQNADMVQQPNAVAATEVVNAVFAKGLKHCELDFYAGTLMLHGMSEFALLPGNEPKMQEVIGLFEKFSSGEIQAKGNFISYEAGGSGAAYLVWKGKAPTLEAHVQATASKMFANQKRTIDGLMTAKFAGEGSELVFIDVAFAVTPFLLYAGLASGNQEYVDFAVFETMELFKILLDEETGLIYQARGFNGTGNFSEDNWSRGIGWGAFALSSLVRDLPKTHPQRQAVEELATRYFTAVLALQDPSGMWHQEMTDPNSFIETSGTGLILHSIGIMLEKGLLPEKYRSDFLRGLQGYMAYIGSDGAISHTCGGCLCPGKGTKADYASQPWRYNDHHSFGPAILAFSQAIKLGIGQVVPTLPQGTYTIHAQENAQPWTYVTHAGKDDLAWENDRIAFRVYGPKVRQQVGSGIDVWAKTVTYPIIDKWYQLNAEGQDYHSDRGEGGDFYNMGKARGCGGTAIWVRDTPYVAATYDVYSIRKNQNDGLTFDLQYNTWNVPNLDIREQKKVNMDLGSNVFEVSSTFRSPDTVEIIVGIGLTDFGKAQVTTDRKRGIISIWEPLETGKGSLGTAIVVDPATLVGFTTYQNDEYVLVRVKTNEPFTYQSGANWGPSGQFKDQKDWQKYLKSFSVK